MLACTTAAQMLVAAAPGLSSAKVHVLSWQWCCSDMRNGLSWSYSRVTNRARSTGLLWYGPATLPVGEPCMTVIWELRVHGTTSCMNSLPGPVAIHLAKTTPLHKPCAHLVRRRRRRSKSKSKSRRRRRRHTNTS